MGIDGFWAQPNLRLRDRFLVFSFLGKRKMARVEETLTYAKKFATTGGSPHVAPEGGSDFAWYSRGSHFKEKTDIYMIHIFITFSW